MKITKRIFALALCLILCLGLCVTASAAEITDGTVGELNDKVVVSADPSAPVASESAQTITVTVDFTETAVLNAISSSKVYVPSEWSVEVQGLGYQGPSGTEGTVSVGYDSNDNKMAGGYSDPADYRHIHGLRFTYTVPAGAQGEYTLGCEDLWVGTIGGVSVINGKDVTKSVTIAAPVSYTATFVAGTGGSGTGPAEITGSSITLPANTFTNSDATMTFVGWLSGADGKVYPAGAKVTLTGDTTFTAQWASYAIELQPNVTKVGLGGTVEIKLVSTGTAFHAYDISVTYETDKFSYDGADGSVNVRKFDQTISADGVIATLSFTAKTGFTETVTGSFGFSKAKVAESVAALGSDAADAGTTGASVDIVPEYIVRFFKMDGSQIGDDIKVDYNTALMESQVPAAPSENHYTFIGWKSSADSSVKTAAEIAALTVTAAVDYTAQYDPDKYDVAKDNSEITGPVQATYGEPYEGTVVGAPDENYGYTVTVEFPNGTTKDYPVDDTGKFVISDEITGPIKITLNKTLQGVAVKTYMDYVGGHTLIVAYGISANGYTYNGNAMFRAAYYDADEANTVTNGKAFAFLIKGGVSDAEAFEKLDAASAAPVEIIAGNDVNNTGTTDIADVQAVADCYNVKGDLATYMTVYLRADRDANHKVETADANIVLGALA